MEHQPSIRNHWLQKQFNLLIMAAVALTTYGVLIYGHETFLVLLQAGALPPQISLIGAGYLAAIFLAIPSLLHLADLAEARYPSKLPGFAGFLTIYFLGATAVAAIAAANNYGYNFW